MLVTTKEKIKEKWKNEVAGTKGEEEDEEKKKKKSPSCFFMRLEAGGLRREGS
ncbi:hypothetical protein PP707_00355 [Acetobacter pasteurianus]|nr:hypothetical protein [Acetobacter pasteurianus]